MGNTLHEAAVAAKVSKKEVHYFDAHFDCPECGAIKAVYAIPLFNLGRCIVCTSRVNIPASAKAMLNKDSFVPITS